MTPEEKNQLELKVCVLTNEVNNLKKEKKAVAKEYKERIDEKEFQINSILIELDIATVGVIED